VYAVWNEKDTVNSAMARKEILKVLQYENGWMLDFDRGIYFETGE
jgi:hypothetical protein